MAEKDSSIASAAKATLVGGAIFLIPGFIAFFVLGKVFGALRALATALGPQLGITSKIGGLFLDIGVIAAILLVCFAAGLLARRATAQQIRTKLDHFLLGSFPGYAFVKNLAENLQQNEQNVSSFIPVAVKFDDYWQVAFETDRLSGGIVAVYLPGAPNTWSGSLVFVSSDRVSKLPLTINESLKITRSLGKGSEALAAQLRALESGQ